MRQYRLGAPACLLGDFCALGQGATAPAEPPSPPADSAVVKRKAGRGKGPAARAEEAAWDKDAGDGDPPSLADLLARSAGGGASSSPAGTRLCAQCVSTCCRGQTVPLRRGGSPGALATLLVCTGRRRPRSQVSRWRCVTMTYCKPSVPCSGAQTASVCRCRRTRQGRRARQRRAREGRRARRRPGEAKKGEGRRWWQRRQARGRRSCGLGGAPAPRTGSV